MVAVAAVVVAVVGCPGAEEEEAAALTTHQRRAEAGQGHVTLVGKHAGETLHCPAPFCVGLPVVYLLVYIYLF